MVFAVDYLVFVFLACCGAMQVAAWWSRLSGLFLVPSRHGAGMGGVLLLVGSFAWFFGSENRIVPADTQGLPGAQAFGMFVLGCALAVVCTVVLSSVTSPARGREPPEEGGLDALRQTTYLKSVQASVRGEWRRWYGRMRPSSSR